jgi:hypothetical protein
MLNEDNQKSQDVILQKNKEIFTVKRNGWITTGLATLAGILIFIASVVK